MSAYGVYVQPWEPRYDDSVRFCEAFLAETVRRIASAPEPVKPLASYFDEGYFMVGSEDFCQLAVVARIPPKALRGRPEVVGLTLEESEYLALRVAEFNRQHIHYPLLNPTPKKKRK